MPWKNRLSRALSPTTFSPGRWWPSFVPFTRRSFCPWTFLFSPSCRSTFQRPVAVWLRASPSIASFVTLKRRQLSSHMWCLQSSTRRRRTCSWTRSSRQALFSLIRLLRLLALRLVNLSLFKPHLKASSSTTPSRRPPYSSSSAQRGPARQFSRQSSSQRSSSPFRL